MFVTINMNLAELKSFQSLGCSDLKKCALAHRVYSDLIHVQNSFSKVEKLYDPDIDTIYLKADHLADGVRYYLPSLSSDPVNMEQIRSLQDRLLGDDKKSIYLGLCDTSSNVLYFKVSQGLQNPAEERSNSAKTKKLKLDTS